MIKFDETELKDGSFLVAWEADTQGEWKRALCAFKTMLPKGKRKWVSEEKYWLIDPTVVDIYKELKLALSSDQSAEILNQFDEQLEEQIILEAVKHSLHWRGSKKMQARAVFAIRAATGIIDVPVSYSLSRKAFGAWNEEAEVWFYEDGRYSSYSPSDLDKMELLKAHERMALAYKRYTEDLANLDDEWPSISEQQQLRLDMLIKYNYQCYVCKIRPDNLRELHMHRVIPGKEGGTYEESNVVILCRKHHRNLEGLGWDDVHKMKQEYSNE